MFLRSVIARRAGRSAFSAASRNASSLIVADHDGKNLNDNVLALVTAATKIGGSIDVLVVGSGVGDVAKQASAVSGVTKVLTADNAALANAVAENLCSVLKPLGSKYSHILTAANNSGKNFIPRLGAMLDVAPLNDVISVVDESTFTRPMYAGNAVATVKMSDSVKLITVRTTAFDKASASGGSAPIEQVSVSDADANAGKSSFQSANIVKSARPDLTAAKVVVSGGRGMKNGENFKMLEDLADKLGGAVGASRAAVDAGFVSNELQIGQTGKVVAPDLYIAVGISGAIQHISGMKDSKTIVAINKDKEAPIFQIADYGLPEDLFKAIPDLTSKV
mmetsp:Transcript_78388/g.169440  ORF Transcript_78388/g.169440 Transcript_78388/m.169440 type:complete len:335 (-) Transcript_78388:119-1123(-)